MSGDITNEEREIFREAYQYFAAYCTPPANQDEDAVAWWTAAAKEVCTLDHKWQEYPLMRGLLLAIYEYMEHKAKEKTEEAAEFVPEC